MRRRFSLPLIALAAVAGSLVVAAPASAHGYVSSPPSRQALCAQGVVACGQIKYEPQSVEGPQGLHSCSGGNAQFAELDDNSKNWPATSVGSTVTFNWVFTARHSTRNWQYFIGNTLLASISGNNQQPPASVAHTVSLGGFTGRQTILAVWNIADTANAFYSCIDVQLGGGGGGGTPPPPGRCSAPTWSPTAVYVGGNTVSYNGHTWKAKWWTQGETPGTSDVWADQGTCSTRPAQPQP
jgi:predicted carbohydrate-binding protein with CBM5 and CBM33 domain